MADNAVIQQQADRVQGAADGAIEGKGSTALVAQYLQEASNAGNGKAVADTLAWRGVREGGWNEAEVTTGKDGAMNGITFFGGGTTEMHCNTQSDKWTCEAPVRK
jgi:hypothetical protein